MHTPNNEEIDLHSIVKRLKALEEAVAENELRAERRHSELMALIELSSIHQRVSSLEIKALVRN